MRHSYALPNGISGPNTGVFMMGATHFQVAEIEVFAVKEMDSAILDSTLETNLLNLIGEFFAIINTYFLKFRNKTFLLLKASRQSRFLFCGVELETDLRPQDSIVFVIIKAVH